MEKNLNSLHDWTFECSDIARGFDNHVREQLPWYDLATGAIAHIARHYIPHGGLVYDIGAATGNIGRAIAATLKERDAILVPIEASKNMADQYNGPGSDRIVIGDATQFDFDPFDVAICFLTVMFFPISQRANFIKNLVAKCRPGGVVLIMDKMEASSGYLATVLWRMTLAGKLATGVDPSEIIAKELSLGGIQRPIRIDELGNSAVEWFRFGDFAGWIIESRQ